MRKKFITTLIALAAVAFISTSCDTMPKTVPFIEADHYFANNDVTFPSNPIIVTSQSDFEKYFGMAAVMGKGGVPTTIDFDKEFVIAVVEPITDIETDLEPKYLTKKGDKLVLTYEKEVSNERMSYSMQPMFLIFVDRKYLSTSVELKEQLER